VRLVEDYNHRDYVKYGRVIEQAEFIGEMAYMIY